jgi:hypothetical protein
MAEEAPRRPLPKPNIKPPSLEDLTAGTAAQKRQVAANAGGSGSYGAGNATPAAGSTGSTIYRPNPVGNYTPGGYNDPSIDWAAIIRAFGPQPAPYDTPDPNGPPPNYNAPAEAAPAVAPQIEAPQQVTAPPAVAPAPAPDISAGRSGGAVDEGPAITKFGNAGTFGQMQRLRQARGPISGVSMTPELLRRAASRRIGM